MKQADSQAEKRSGMSRQWNWHPALPLPLVPFFDYPLRPKLLLSYLQRTWASFGMTIIDVLVAFAVLAWLQPSAAEMMSLAGFWTFEIWARNFLLVWLFAGTLHYFFYTADAQGLDYKFDARPQKTASKAFTFRDQVWDNMFWTLVPGVLIWSLYEILYFWAFANGNVPTITFQSNPVWYIVMFQFVRLWHSFHFYWAHRLLHVPFLYRIAHGLHHRNINVGPWSGLSMHPIEHVLYYSSILIHFVVPSSPVHVLFHLYVLSLSAIVSHSGYAAFRISGKKRGQLGAFFHQLHHRYFECNYGAPDLPWDRWFGTFHDGTEEATVQLREKRSSPN